MLTAFSFSLKSLLLEKGGTVKASFVHELNFYNLGYTFVHVVLLCQCNTLRLGGENDLSSNKILRECFKPVTDKITPFLFVCMSRDAYCNASSLLGMLVSIMSSSMGIYVCKC